MIEQVPSDPTLPARWLVARALKHARENGLTPVLIRLPAGAFNLLAEAEPKTPIFSLSGVPVDVTGQDLGHVQCEDGRALPLV